MNEVSISVSIPRDADQLAEQCILALLPESLTEAGFPTDKSNINVRRDIRTGVRAIMPFGASAEQHEAFLRNQP